jgi:hypothetical protein
LPKQPNKNVLLFSIKNKANLKLKIDIRRDYINNHLQGQPLKVVETCAGEYGFIWNTLKKEFNIQQYIGFDQNPIVRGIIQGDAEQLISGVNVSQFNVIDIDTCESPWAILLNTTKVFKGQAVLFLTIGKVIEELSNFEKGCLGIPLNWEVGYDKMLFQKSIPYCLKEVQGKCELKDIILYWHEDLRGKATAYLAAFIDGSNNKQES